VSMLNAIIAGIFMWPSALANAWMYVLKGAPAADIAAVVAVTAAAAIHINSVADEFASRVGDGLWKLGPHVMFTNAGAALMYTMILISLLHGMMSASPLSSTAAYLMFMSWPAGTFWGIVMGVIRGLLEESGEIEGGALAASIGSGVLAIIVAVYLALTLPWPWNIIAGAIGVASPILAEYLVIKYRRDPLLL